MAKQFDALEPWHTDFIAAQHVFFVGTAAETGRVNVSPKGMDSLRVLEPNRLIWRNLSGSGNETAGHLAQVNRMTLMWCAFEGRPMILRCYGTAKTVHVGDDGFDALNVHFPAHVGARQIYDMQIDLVQTSCGYAVPSLSFDGERDILTKWANDKGSDGIKATWARDNTHTIDGFETGILK